MLASFSLLLSACSGLPKPSPERERFEDEVAALVQQSRESEPACAAYEAEARKLLAQGDAVPLPQLMGLARSYPGRPAAGSRAIGLLEDRVAEYPEFDSRLFLEIRVCRALPHYEILTRIVRSAQPASPQAAKDKDKEKRQRAEARDLVADGIRNLLSGSGTMIETVLAIQLITDLEQSGLIAVSDPLFVALLSLSEEARAVREKVRENAKQYPDFDPLELKLSARTRRQANEAWVKELRLTQPLRDRARRLFDRAARAG